VVELAEFSEENREQIVKWTADFFGFHAGLVRGKIKLSESDYMAAEETISTWMSEGHLFHIIRHEGDNIGFIHICFRSGTVAWIEDIYVLEAFRGKGVASSAILLAEKIIMEDENYTAVCMDVSPRNLDALKLYYRLGYTDLSLITVRKELGKSRWNKNLNLLGIEYKY